MYHVRRANRWAVVDARGIICDGSQDEMEDIYDGIVAGEENEDFYDLEDMHPPILLVCVVKWAE